MLSLLPQKLYGILPYRAITDCCYGVLTANAKWPHIIDAAMHSIGLQRLNNVMLIFLKKLRKILIISCKIVNGFEATHTGKNAK